MNRAGEPREDWALPHHNGPPAMSRIGRRNGNPGDPAIDGDSSMHDKRIGWDRQISLHRPTSEDHALLRKFYDDRLLRVV